MYEAYYIKYNDFIYNKTEQQMTEFMCSIHAGKTGHTAFKIGGNSGKCLLGAIKVNATQSPTGVKTYVKSGIPVQKCMISPIVVDNQMGADNIKYLTKDYPCIFATLTEKICRYPVSSALLDNQKDSNGNIVSEPYNYWIGQTGVSPRPYFNE